MGFTRRRRGRRKNRSALDYFDWRINPGLVREILAILFFVISLLSILGWFELAGGLGQLLDDFQANLFGVVRFILPPIFFGLGVLTWSPELIKIRWASLVGITLLVVFLPALSSPYGGIFGKLVADFMVKSTGNVAGFLLLIGTVVVALMLIFDTPLKSFWQTIFQKGIAVQTTPTSTTDGRVSVFQSIKNRFTTRIPTYELPSQSKRGEPLKATNSTENWIFPPLDLLKLPTTKATPGNIAKNVDLIAKTLNDFGIEVTMGDVNIGPTVTQYTLKPAEGIKLSQITARANDIALALAAHPIRIEAPIPGKAAVGIEVPNKVSAIVTLREILETTQFKDLKSNLTIALGRDAAGTPVAVDLKKMPHLLIAGATGSGKSIAINSIITALIYQNTPADLRLILVDPKRVEFTAYNGISHLLVPVIVDPDKTVNTLKWALTEMDRRFRLFQEAGSRDILSFNARVKSNPLPYIVIIIDELADLMAQSAKEVEGAIVRIAQMARAVGMHLIVATQRPSVDVITGLIKANITSRVAFTVASQVDSRTILDVAGAEKLLGNGDMLYLSNEYLGKPRRIQGCFMGEGEIISVSGFLKKNSTPTYDEAVMSFIPRSSLRRRGGDTEIDDELYEESKQLVAQAGKASASLLQRRLRIGYARAARLLDLLEEQGVIGPADGARPRDVLIGLDDDSDFSQEV